MTLVEIHGDIPTRAQFGCAAPAGQFFIWLQRRGYSVSITELAAPIAIPPDELDRALSLLRDMHDDAAR